MPFLNLKLNCTSFLTAYSAQSFSGNILNLNFTLYQNNLFILAFQDVLIGIITLEYLLLNYFLLIVKLYVYGIAEDLKYFQA